MSTLDDLKSRFFKFRSQKYAIYVGLVLTFLICSLLLIYAACLLCFGVLLVALAGYYIPYFFGMKSKKKLAVWGVVLLLLLSLPYLVVIVGQQKSSESIKLSTEDGSLYDGTVSPFYGNANTNHTFSIMSKSSNYSQVNVIVVDMWSSTTVYNRTMTPTNVSGGQLYTFYADPSKGTGLNNNSEYNYWFVAKTGTGWVATTNSNYGPMHVSDVDIYLHWWPLLLLVLFIEVGVLYFLLLGLSIMTDRSKARMKEMQTRQGGGNMPPSKGGKDEKFVCSECGADVPATADKCPQCGEKFDEEKSETSPVADKGKDEFFCTDCGAKVDEDAKKCWNCGKEFEN
jgi:ribosomal protein L40E